MEVTIPTQLIFQPNVKSRPTLDQIYYPTRGTGKKSLPTDFLFFCSLPLTPSHSALLLRSDRYHIEQPWPRI